MIKTIDISKTFKIKNKEIKAVDDVSFEIERNSTGALVGPNGAGKTTIIKMLSTLIIPSSGDALVNGYSITKEEKKVRESIGLVTVSERLFYYRLTALENLIFFASLQNLSLSDARKRAKEVLEIVGLSEWGNIPYMKFSTGMQRKLALARALITDPPVLLLDEPTLGLDPLSARMFRDLVRRIGRDKTILLTSHYMKDIEELAEKIILLKKGKAIAEGNKDNLKNYLGKVIEVEVNEYPLTLGKYVVQTSTNYYILRIPEKELDELKDYRVIKEEEPSLEDVYIYLIGDVEDSARLEAVRRGGWGGRWG
ncbi:ABC transporter ATP-binding protein [Saccharolobus solfataricus]|uniref:ABC transporter, ATP binding protein n=3 Tax=Saccharolobus solfataricus TaxID=2287 RepID=Q97VH6_SACS2|nr:ABC transporter ATP-binding protein [Saccharolobus solfataricus]AAK42768.1 ABC transporter, ATP binding protein [Saccharolobus solfataricus P2]AKA72861.1 ABC transporter ATP-binding protein [Saccharolobus solfataricus]AKA75559.1 ABC transporter ATP-binding protein [Saccharolobus solfataricus]AKA78253.1 ABC transporter ATP-binding protein [Saccharolobus solfataricus]AZF67371.1 ABC transporter ATP-binding protein [Saccharolobus solfataricus]